MAEKKFIIKSFLSAASTFPFNIRNWTRISQISSSNSRSNETKPKAVTLKIGNVLTFSCMTILLYAQCQRSLTVIFRLSGFTSSSSSKETLFDFSACP
jgi:hypothetical protein